MSAAANEGKPRNIYQRISAIMAECPGVPKARHNSHGNYKYAGHSDVTAALRGLYVKHGIVRYASINCATRSNGDLRLDISVRWINIDDPEDRVIVDMVSEAPCTTKNGSPTAQQAGVALSYAVKQAELKLFALKDDDTPDVNDDDYHGNHGSPERETPPSDLEDFVASFTACASVSDIDAVTQRVKANRDRLGNRRDAIKLARDEALQRVAEREPGSDG